MGLDITAYSRCVFLHGTKDPAHSDACWDDERHVDVYPGAPAFVARLDGKATGCYRSKGESFDFRAGSYGGYNAWRGRLCNLFLEVDPERVWDDPDAFAGRPFVELVNMADNEGAIGPVTSKKLAADFEAHVGLTEGEDPYFVEKYADWHKAFGIAADDGFVVFH